MNLGRPLRRILPMRQPAPAPAPRREKAPEPKRREKVPAKT